MELRSKILTAVRDRLATIKFPALPLEVEGRTPPFTVGPSISSEKPASFEAAYVSSSFERDTQFGRSFRGRQTEATFQVQITFARTVSISDMERSFCDDPIFLPDDGESPSCIVELVRHNNFEGGRSDSPHTLFMYFKASINRRS